MPISRFHGNIDTVRTVKNTVSVKSSQIQKHVKIKKRRLTMDSDDPFGEYTYNQGE